MQHGDDMITDTIYYKITLDAAIEAYKDDNLIMYQALKEYGWDAIDTTKYLLGSDIVDDILYVCVTDGINIEVDDEFVPSGSIDPEEALAAVGPESLTEYIETPTDEEIIKHLTPYDLNDDIIDLSDLAEKLLLSGHSFEDIVKSAVDAQLLEV